jgi:hypothetical protein
MTWNEARNVLYGYNETFIVPEDVEDAIGVAILALSRCDFLDEQAEKRKKIGNHKIEKGLTPEENRLKQELKDMMNS